MVMSEKKFRLLYLAYLEADSRLIPELWSPRLVRVPASEIGDLAASLIRLGCLVKVARTEEEAEAEADDLRKRCCRCEDGLGKHVCDRCQHESLLDRLERSLIEHEHIGQRLTSDVS